MKLIRRFVRSIPIFSLLLAVSLIRSLRADDFDRGSMQLPDNFTLELAAGSNLVTFPMCAAFDERGRLFITESSGKNVSGKTMAEVPECRVSMLEDTNNDGIFDKSTVFADKLSLPMGALWYRGSLYVATPPDFVRLDDANADGVSEHREVLLTGWNVLNTASLHGPFLGPDGRMYLTHGRHGYKIKTKEGEMLEGLAPRIWRCRPDGSGLEGVCGGGFDNPVELIFTGPGEMLGTMTYFTDPKNGQRDALMHWVEGGVYPKPHESISEFKRTGDLMPVMTKFARIAPAGLVRYRGDAFGPEFKGNLFSAQFNPHRVQRHILTRNGATFQTEDSDFLVSSDPDFHPTDVIEDADGSMLVLDTGGWYVDACPLSKISKPDFRGAVYRIRRKDAARVADARALGEDLAHKSPKELVRYLEDPRPAVRDRAADLLAQKGKDAIDPLAGVLKKSDSADARISALWTLSQIDTDGAREKVRSRLDDDDPDLRIAAAHALGLARDRKSTAKLAKLVEKDEAPVRREAATALGRIGETSTANPLLKAAKRADDRFLEHSIIYALIQLADPKTAREALGNKEPRIRKAALIALDQMNGSPLRREQIAPFLRDSNEDLRHTALWVVSHHADWSGEVIGFLRDQISAHEFTDAQAAAAREAFASFANDDGIQDLIAQLLANPSLDPNRKTFLIDAMEKASPKKFPKAWIEQLARQLESKDANLRTRSLALIRSRDLSELDPQVEGIADNPGESVSLRISALGALIARKRQLSDANVDLLSKQLAKDTDAALRLQSAQVLARAELTDPQLNELATKRLVEADSLVLSPLLDAFRTSKDGEVGKALVDALSQSSAGLGILRGDRLDDLLKNFPPEIQQSAQPLLQRIQDAEAEHLRKLTELEPLLSGGDIGRGRQIFYGKKSACSTCHAVGSEGGTLGPDLTSIGQIRSGRDILEALVFPSATFVPGYEPFRIETARDTYAGVIASQSTDAVVLKTGADAEVRLTRSEIRSMEPSAVSVMPEGLDTGLTQPELLDLLAYLQAQNGEQWLLSKPRQSQRIPLFNGKDLTGFYTYLEDSGSDNDPDKVFSVQDGMLRISGQHYGYLATKTDARNYRLVAEFMWGEQTWPPRKENARDSGVLVHATGVDKVWPTAIECQMIEGGTGDIIVIPDAKLTVNRETKTHGRFDRPGRNPWDDKLGFRGANEIERPHGEWNTLEITCDDDTISIKVNGRPTLEGIAADPKAGRILLQSEGAEVFFRRIDLYPLR